MAYKPKLIIPAVLRNSISTHEIEAAKVLSSYFRQEVQFITPSKGYRVKTPDILIGSAVAWEIKCPEGNSGRATIQKQLKGLRQSRNLVIDGRRTKMDDVTCIKLIISELKREYRRPCRVIYIDKRSAVIECGMRK